MQVLVTGTLSDSAGQFEGGEIEFTQAQRWDDGSTQIVGTPVRAQVVNGGLLTLSGAPFYLPMNPASSAVKISERLGGRTFVWFAAVPAVVSIDYRTLWNDYLVESADVPESVFAAPAWLVTVQEGLDAVDALGGIADITALVDSAEASAVDAAASAAAAAASASDAAAAVTTLDTRLTVVETALPTKVSTVNGIAGPDVVLTAASVGAVPTSQVASTTVQGIVELATNTEASAGTDSVRAVTPLAARTANAARYEVTGASVAALGTGQFVGQQAIVTISGANYPVVWSGSAWVLVSGLFSGTLTQRNALAATTLVRIGLTWYDTASGRESVWTGSVWRLLLSSALDVAWGRVDTVGVATLGAGFTHDPDPFYDGFNSTVVDGVVSISGRLVKASIAANDLIITVNAAYRPSRTVVQYAYASNANFVTIQPNGECRMALAGTSGVTFSATWPL